jgi:hypothetical protein
MGIEIYLLLIPLAIFVTIELLVLITNEIILLLTCKKSSILMKIEAIIGRYISRILHYDIK